MMGFTDFNSNHFKTSREMAQPYFVSACVCVCDSWKKLCDKPTRGLNLSEWLMINDASQ